MVSDPTIEVTPLAIGFSLRLKLKPVSTKMDIFPYLSLHSEFGVAGPYESALTELCHILYPRIFVRTFLENKLPRTL